MREIVGHGCWKCRSVESRVADSDMDEDGVRVRLRQCIDCGEYWDTEERRISKGAFYGRAVHRRQTEARRRKSKVYVCRVCRGPYRSGTYPRHKLEELHVKTVEAGKERRRLQMKAASRRWYDIDRRIRREMQKRAAA